MRRTTIVMAKYRKKPVIIEAEVYQKGMEDGFDTIGEAIVSGFRENSDYILPVPFMGIPYINTLEGKHYISRGDYIITGVMGERYPCKPDIFEMTYELVDDEKKIENCWLIKHGLSLGIGEPEVENGMCQGYCTKISDEPTDECKECKYLWDRDDD